MTWPTKANDVIKESKEKETDQELQIHHNKPKVEDKGAIFEGIAVACGSLVGFCTLVTIIVVFIKRKKSIKEDSIPLHIDEDPIIKIIGSSRREDGGVPDLPSFQTLAQQLVNPVRQSMIHQTQHEGKHFIAFDIESSANLLDDDHFEASFPRLVYKGSAGYSNK